MKKQTILWIAALLAGLIIVWFVGYKIIMDGFTERMILHTQQHAMMLNARLKSQHDKILMLQKVMQSFLKYESQHIVLPDGIPEKDNIYLYHGAARDSVFRLSPYPLSKEMVETTTLIVQGIGPYVKRLPFEFGSLARFYLRFKTGAVIEYYYRDLPSDSELKSGYLNTAENRRPVDGILDSVKTFGPFIDKTTKKELLTRYTGLMYHDSLIGEICMDIETNYYGSWLKTNLKDVHAMFFDTTGCIYTSDDPRYMTDDTVENIYDNLPNFRSFMLSTSKENGKDIAKHETDQLYVFTQPIGTTAHLALYITKKALLASTFSMMIPFLLAFVALWSASWAYYKQRIVSRKLKIMSLDLEVAKKEAESANDAKSVFLANMSHEIRTPMNAIIGFSQILSSIVKDPVQSNYVRSISTSGKTLLSLINDILDLSKIEAGKLEIRPEPFSIRQLLSEVSSLFQMKAEEKGLSIIVDVDESMPEYLVADELRLRQILLNFMSNAMKFTDEGEIKLSAGSINRSEDALDLRIGVKDSGIGIRKDQIGKIFGAFEQVEKQDTRKYGGTGLGLAITNKLVTMMGGRIDVESEPMVGSTFSIHLPGIRIFSGELKTTSVEWEKLDRVRFEHANILVVDDIQDNRSVLAGMLTMQGFTITEASNGKEAIDLIRQSQPALVLTDLRMPVMDGFTLAKMIRDDAATVSLPVIAVSASVFHQHEQDVKLKGFDSFIRKPVVLQEMLSELCRFLPHDFSEENEDLVEKSLQPPVNITLEDLKLLGKLLAAEALPLVETALKRQSIQAARQLLAMVTPYVQKYQWEPFTQWAGSVQVAVDSFDITMMEKELREFKPLLENVLNAISQMDKS